MQVQFVLETSGTPLLDNDLLLHNFLHVLKYILLRILSQVALVCYSWENMSHSLILLSFLEQLDIAVFCTKRGGLLVHLDELRLLHQLHRFLLWYSEFKIKQFDVCLRLLIICLMLALFLVPFQGWIQDFFEGISPKFGEHMQYSRYRQSICSY